MNKKIDKKDKKYIKGRYTKTVKLWIRFLIYIRDIFSILKYGQAYIFDTNMIVANKKVDKRHFKLFTLNHNYWITETTTKEVETLLASDKYKRILDSRFKELSFGKLREYYPNTCPLYYNYISAMHNPAVVGDENFRAELIIKSLIKNNILTKEEEKINRTVMDNFGNAKNKKNISEFHKLLKDANISNLSKKRNAIRNNDKNYFNDLKSLSLALIYCLQRKRNVTFITSDSDFLNLIFDIFGTVVQQSTFTTNILPLLSDNQKSELIQHKKKLLFFLDSVEFVKHMKNYLIDTFSDNWKKDFLIFKIKYWNIPNQKYTTLEFRFDKTMRQIFLNSHGNLFCPCVKNNENANWVAYMYWWPPSSLHDLKTLKVSVRSKNGIIKKDTFVTDEIHTIHCKYPQQDIKGDLRFFSNFI